MNEFTLQKASLVFTFIYGAAAAPRALVKSLRYIFMWSICFVSTTLMLLQYQTRRRLSNCRIDIYGSSQIYIIYHEDESVNKKDIYFNSIAKIVCP